MLTIKTKRKNNRIKILHLIDTGGPGGAETIFLRLIHSLDNNHFESLAIVPNKDWLYHQLQLNGVNCKILNATGSFNFRYITSLIKIIKYNDIDIIQCHLFGSSVYGSIAGFLSQRPVVSTIHGFVDIDANEKWLKLKLNIINIFSSKITFVSKRLKNYFSQFKIINKAKMVIIPNGVNLTELSKQHNSKLKNELNFKKNDIIIGSVGNIRPAKGYDYLIKAAAELKKQNRNLKFVIIGEGTGQLFNSLIMLKNELGLEDTVFFLGFRDKAFNLIKEFDMLVLPSTSEGFSLVVLEAMANKVPIVSTKCGGPEEILNDSSLGKLVENKNHLKLANGIMQIISTSEEVRQKMINKAYNHVKENYSTTSMANKYSHYYKMLVKNCFY